MPDAFRAIAETLCREIPSEVQVTRIVHGNIWTAAELSDGSTGIAMHTDVRTVPRICKTLVGRSAKQAAQCLVSWNLEEASEAMAVINAWYNQDKRLENKGNPYHYLDSCTTGMSTNDKTVALIGHLGLASDTLKGARQVYVLERKPQPGDYPDTACEEILPQCDLVIITGSAFVNKTISRLLQLSQQAQVITIGPSVPLCPDLKKFGITRLCGMTVQDKEHMFSGIVNERQSGYRYGSGWMLS